MWASIASLIRYAILVFPFFVALIASLYMLSYLVPRAEFVARGLTSYLCLISASFFGIFAGIALSFFGAEGSTQWLAGRAFALLMSFTTGVTFEPQDPHGYLSSTRPAILVGNHQTELDVFMLGAIFPQHCSVTAKASLRKVPVLGWFMSLSRTIFIDRGNSKDARQAMTGAADEIRRRRQSVYIFPEGTRSYSKEPILLPFKKGAFHLAVEAQAPIIPCVVANYSHIFWIKGWIFRRGTIPVKVMEPIPTKGLTSADVDELTRTTREKMLQELLTLTAEAQATPIKIPAAKSAATTLTTKGVVSTAAESS